VWSPSADRVVHADDGLIVREGVRRLLEIDREVVASRGDLGTLLEAVEVQLPDVVMTDTRMLPDSSDRAFVRRSCCRRRIRVSLTTARTCSPRAHPWHVSRGGDCRGIPQQPRTGPSARAGYCSAFVLDPDGNSIEVVNHHR
jgi:DNA-binding NarL/FixJ family response regulator